MASPTDAVESSSSTAPPTLDLLSTLAPTNMTQNASAGNQTGLVRNEALAKVEIAVQATIFFMAVFGNGLVLVVLLALRRKKMSRMNMMIIHLSCADLFVAFFNVLPQLIWDITHRWQGYDFSCRFIKYFQIVAMYASSYVLVSTAIDRYLAICHPLRSHGWSMAKMHALVGVAWGLSLLFSVPQLTIFSYQEIDNVTHTYDCWAVFNPPWTLQLYVTWFTIAIYIIPFIILAVAYGKICYVVWRSMKSKEPSTKGVSYHKTKGSAHHKQENGSLLSRDPSGSNNGKLAVTSHRKEMQNPRAHMRGMSNAKVKTVKLTLTVIICYLVCWGPFFVSQMWAAWDANAPFEGATMVVIMLLASLNSCTNPWIYLAFSDSLHRRLWRCCPARRPAGFTERAAPTFDSDAHYRSSTVLSHTDATRLEASNTFESSFSHCPADRRGRRTPPANKHT